MNLGADSRNIANSFNSNNNNKKKDKKHKKKLKIKQIVLDGDNINHSDRINYDDSARTIRQSIGQAIFNNLGCYDDTMENNRRCTVAE